MVYTFLGQKANGSLHGNILSLAAAEDPVDDADVVTKTRPQELAALIRAEPVDMKDLGELCLERK